MELTFIVVLVITLALIFDFTNGFHDTANAMATPIATGALRPKTAVALAAVLNLVGAFLSTEVAKTISGGIIREGEGGVLITPELIFAGLVGAIVWNLLTWLLGLPSSSSHALFGGLIGAAIVGAGLYAVDFGVLTARVLLPALVAPVVAGVVAFCATRLAYWITRRAEGLPDGRDGFRRAQIFSSSLVALSHGTNDAQKTMGVITLTLIASGMQTPGSGPEFWVIASCAVAIALGTYMGGWRIIRTLGGGLTEVKPAQGFAAETSTAATILASSHLGFALSTTQVASGSVIGSGLGRRGSKVRWKTARKIFVGWLLTLPASGAVGALMALLTHWGPHIDGVGQVGLLLAVAFAAATMIGIYLWSRREQVDHKNAMAAVAQASKAVKIKKNPRPIKRRRQRRAEDKAKRVAEAAKKSKEQGTKE